jgi:hypothetical protein
MGADDQRIRHGFEPPSRRNALHLTRRVVTVAAGTDHRRVGTPVDPIKSRIVGAVEEILHQAGHGGQVLGRAEDVAVRFEEIGGLSCRRPKHADGGSKAAPRAAASTICRGPPVIE